MSAPKINLNIEQLVLDGVAPHQRRRVVAAIERELARLFAQHGVPESLAQGGAIPSLDLDSLKLRPDMGGDAIGVQVAQALHSGLTGGR